MTAPVAGEVYQLLAGADPVAVSRTVMSLAAMHEPDRSGRCRYCRAGRWLWWRRTGYPCPTRRVLVAELRTAVPVRWTPA
ncbi:MAG TPA: hypothetical protein VFX70_14140 [Mycobacteriales bacterium]|nr:hypothetical protein [Mycobacteriales bacterium]